MFLHRSDGVFNYPARYQVWQRDTINSGSRSRRSMLLHRDRLHLPLITCVLTQTDSFQPALDDCFNIGLFNAVAFYNKCEERRQGQRAAGSGSKRVHLPSERVWRGDEHSLCKLHLTVNVSFFISCFLFHYNKGVIIIKSCALKSNARKSDSLT